MKLSFAVATMGILLLFVTGCEQGIDDWNSSAKITGEIYTDATHTHGVPGVRVIIEADPNASNPYKGPDRWTETDSRGHFDGAVFLGNQDGQYNYLADLSVAYFYNGKAFSWSGGISVGPGSVFTLPPVDTTMFVPVSGSGGN